MIEDLARAASAGYFPGAAATTKDGQDVVLTSYPYTDGTLICVLGSTNPSDPGSWSEFRLDELVLRDCNRTPLWRTSSTQPNSSRTSA